MPGGLFDQRLFGPLVAHRECGRRTACCVEIAIAVPMLSRPPRVACVHYTGGGYAIYDDRPGDCRECYRARRRIAELPVISAATAWRRAFRARRWRFR